MQEIELKACMHVDKGDETINNEAALQCTCWAFSNELR